MEFLIIFTLLGLGYGLQKLVRNHEKLASNLNLYVLWIALPALTFQHMNGIQFNWYIFIPASVAWVSFLAAWVWVQIISSKVTLDRPTKGCLLLTCGLGNTSFVGFPLIKWLYGPDALKTALLVDQPGSFLVLSTLGIACGSIYIGQTPKFKEISKRILTFPPFICFGLALGMTSIQITWPFIMDSVWVSLGSTLTPAALIAVGLNIHFKDISKFTSYIKWGLSYRLIVSPLIILLLYRFIFNLNDDYLGILVLESGMAPMITGSIVASSLGLNPPLAHLMVSIGIVLSIFTVPLWYLLLQL